MVKTKKSFIPSQCNAPLPAGKFSSSPLILPNGHFMQANSEWQRTCFKNLQIIKSLLHLLYNDHCLQLAHDMTEPI